MVSANGMGNNPNNLPANTLGFVGPTVNITVTATTQKIHLTVHKALGASAAASGLDIFPGYQNTSGGSLLTVGGGMFGLTCPASTRLQYGVNGMITNLSPGTYTVGMVARSTMPANWSNNEWGYITAMLVN